jgi:hypothetical protein
MFEDRFSIFVGHTVERDKTDSLKFLLIFSVTVIRSSNNSTLLTLSSRTADRTITQTISKVRKSDELVIDGIRGDSFIGLRVTDTAKS